METIATTSLLALPALLVASGPGLAQDEPTAEDPSAGAAETAAADSTTEETDAAPTASFEAVGQSAEELMAAASTNVLGEPIAYGSGTPAISAWLITFEPGGHTNLHQHPAPSFVYVMEGELEVQVADGEPYPIKQGQAIIEPQDTTVQAFNVADGPTRIIVVSMASEDKAPSVPVAE